MPQCLHVLQEQAEEVCGRNIYQVPLSAAVQPLVQEFVQQQVYRKRVNIFYSSLLSWVLTFADATTGAGDKMERLTV